MSQAPQLPLPAQRAEIIVRPNSASILVDSARVLGVDASKVCNLLRNVWKPSSGQPPLTDQEMFAGLSMIARFHLDPIAKEIYVTRDKHGRLMTIVAIDGWIKILDRTDHYDGFEQTVEFDEKGKVFSATTTIYSNRRSHPTTYVAYASEYTKVSGNVAEKMPIHMLRIFSLRHAARMFTALGGNIFTEEEVKYMEAESARMAEDQMRIEESATMGDYMEKLMAPHPEVESVSEPERVPEPKPEAEKPAEKTKQTRTRKPSPAKDLFGDEVNPPEQPSYYQMCVGRLNKATTVAEFDSIWKSICDDPRSGRELSQSHAEMLDADGHSIRDALEFKSA